MHTISKLAARMNAAFIAIMSLALLITFCAVMPNEAEAVTPSKKTIYSYNSYSNPYSASTNEYDIDNDGNSDEVDFEAWYRGSYTHWLKIKVNGKTAYNSGKIYGTASFKVQLLTLENGKKFYYIECYGDNYDGIYGIYRYSKGTLKKCCSNEDVKGFSHSYINSIKLSGNKVLVNYRGLSNRFGNMKYSYTYKYQKGTLKRTSSTASKFSVQSSKTGKYTKGYFTAAHKIKAKSSVSSKSKTKTIYKNTKVKITKVAIKGKTMWFKVISKSGKTYWINNMSSACTNSSAGNKCFKEKYVFG